MTLTQHFLQVQLEAAVESRSWGTLTLEFINSLIEKGAEPTWRTLISALKNGNDDGGIARELMERHGLKPDIRALEIAVERRFESLALLMMEKGAKATTEILTESIELQPYTPYSEDLDFYRALMNHGAIPDEKTVACAVRVGLLDFSSELAAFAVKSAAVRAAPQGNAP